MANLGSDLLIVSSDLTANTSVPYHQLGARATTGDGRYFRYALAGGTTLVAGTLLQAPAQVTAHLDLTPAAAAVGATSITISSSITTTSGQYSQGWALISVTPGIGQMLKISTNTAVTGATGCVVTLADPIQVALTTSSRVSLLLNPYSGVVINPTTPTSSAVGVAQFAITNGQYGWIQTGGPSNILSDGGTTVGNMVVASNGTAGAVETATGTQQVIGVAMQTLTTAENGAVFLYNL